MIKYKYKEIIHMGKPKYKIVMETAPSNTYKTKEEVAIAIKKATDLLINELIMSKLNK